MVKSAFGSHASERRGPGFRTSTRAFQVAEDIIPIGELKANMSEVVRGLEKRARPLVVTLNGKAAAVVMAPREYDRLVYRDRVRAAIDEGLADIEAGRVYDGEQVFAELLGSRQPSPARRKRRPR